MSRGFVYTVLSGALLGSLIIVPLCMKSFSAMELVVGRYLAFGGFITLILLFRLEALKCINRQDAGRFLMMALLSNTLYYLFLVIGIRILGGIFVCVLMAALPMIFRKWLFREAMSRHCAVPLVLLLASLLLMVIQKVDEYALHPEGQSIATGLFWLMLASVCWLWGTRVQVGFVRSSPDIDASDYLIITGLCSLLSLPLLFPLTLLELREFHFFPDGFTSIQWHEYGLSMLVVGVFITGLARIFWRKATLYASHGVFYPNFSLETLFGILFVFSLEGRLPDLLEWAVIVILACGLLVFYRNKALSMASGARDAASSG
jgi:drug/metabolite transporter (DMT)-like permease